MIRTVTGRGGLAGLPALLDLVGADPAPDAVAEALVNGPVAEFGVHAAIVLVTDGQYLRLVGSHGYSPDELADFEAIPLAADLPVCQAVREAETIVTSGTVAGDDYAARAQDPHRGARMRSTRRAGSIVDVPVSFDGFAVGAYGFTCDTDRTWTARDLQLLDAIASVLALWLAHPRTGLVIAVDPAAGTALLTPRQCAILRLVAHGKTTEAIGAALGYSSSTVKKDITRAMRALEVTTRQAAATRADRLGLCRGAGS